MHSFAGITKTQLKESIMFSVSGIDLIFGGGTLLSTSEGFSGDVVFTRLAVDGAMLNQPEAMSVRSGVVGGIEC